MKTNVKMTVGISVFALLKIRYKPMSVKIIAIILPNFLLSQISPRISWDPI